MLQSGHGSRDRRTDGRTDRRTDRRTDGVKPIYPPTTSLFGGYKNALVTGLVPSSNKPLPERILSKFNNAIQPHYAAMNWAIFQFLGPSNRCKLQHMHKALPQRRMFHHRRDISFSSARMFVWSLPSIWMSLCVWRRPQRRGCMLRLSRWDPDILVLWKQHTIWFKSLAPWEMWWKL